MVVKKHTKRNIKKLHGGVYENIDNIVNLSHLTEYLKNRNINTIIIDYDEIPKLIIDKRIKIINNPIYENSTNNETKASEKTKLTGLLIDLQKIIYDENKFKKFLAMLKDLNIDLILLTSEFNLNRNVIKTKGLFKKKTIKPTIQNTIANEINTYLREYLKPKNNCPVDFTKNIFYISGGKSKYFKPGVYTQNGINPIIIMENMEKQVKNASNFYSPFSELNITNLKPPHAAGQTSTPKSHVVSNGKTTFLIPRHN